MKRFIFVLPMLLLLAGCELNPGCVWDDCAEPEVCTLDNGCLSGESFWDDIIDVDDVDVVELWQTVLTALKNDDMQSLTSFIDPEIWVRFSSYWNVTDDDVVLFADDLLWERNETLTRWMYDGSGNPIEMTIKQFFEEFVYNHDYLQAPEVIKWNMITRWNTIININEYYPNWNCIEYYFPAFNPEYGWMDWESLVLIFDKNSHKLIWISHEQWTV